MYQAVGDEDDARPNIRNAKRARTLTQPIAPKKDRYVKPNSTATLYSQSANYAARVDQTHQGKRESGVFVVERTIFHCFENVNAQCTRPCHGGAPGLQRRAFRAVAHAVVAADRLLFDVHASEKLPTATCVR